MEKSGKIFESPDGGHTVYEREIGSNQRRLTEKTKENVRHTLAKMQEDKMWGEIRRMADINPTMQDAVERVIMLYKLIKEEQRG